MVDCVATKARSNGASRLGGVQERRVAERHRALAAVELADAVAVDAQRLGDRRVADDRRDVGAGARERRREDAADTAATNDCDAHGPEE